MGNELIRLANAVTKLQKLVIEAQAEAWIDRIFMTCILSACKNPEDVKLYWQESSAAQRSGQAIAISAFSYSDDADLANLERLLTQAGKDAANKRLRHWDKMVALACRAKDVT